MKDNLSSDIDNISRKYIDGDEFDEDQYCWRENPVLLREFVESKNFLGLPPLSERQYRDIEGVIGKDPKKIFSPENQIEYGVLVWGKGSGKDYCCSIVQAYIVYILLNLKDPKSYFLFPPDEALDIINIARKGEQSERVYFTKFVQKIKKWRWLWDSYTIVEKGRLLNKKGKPRIEITGSSVIFPNGIRAYSETSENESFEGYNIIFWVLDEVSGFVGPTGKKNATKIFNTLRTSTTSRKNRRFKGLGFMISYPRAKEDLILDEYKKFAKGENTYVFGSFGTPWEIKPPELFKGEVFDWTDGKGVAYAIPVEYKNDFEQNPEDAKTKYLCMPPLVEGGYMEFPEKAASILTDLSLNPFTFDEVIKTEQLTGGGENIYVWKNLINVDAVKLNYLKSLRISFGFHADSSKTTCNTALSIGYKESYLDEFEGKRMLRDRIVTFLVLVWRPDPEKKIQISLDNVELIIKSIGKHIPLFGTFDHWNSQQILERLNRSGIVSEARNVTRDDYESLRGKIYAGEFIVPDCEDARLGLTELIHLVETGQGKPKKGDGFSQDVVDTWAGLMHLLSSVKPHAPGMGIRPPVGVRMSGGPRNDIFTGSSPGNKKSVVDLKEVFDKGKPSKLEDQRDKLLGKIDSSLDEVQIRRLQKRPPTGVLGGGRRKKPSE